MTERTLAIIKPDAVERGLSGKIIQRIEAVTAEDLLQMAAGFFKTESIAVTVLGNLDGLKISRDQLAC